MSDVLNKVMEELEGNNVRFDISEDELAASLSMLDDLAEFVESNDGNTKPIHDAIKALATFWIMCFGDGMEVKINDR